MFKRSFTKIARVAALASVSAIALGAASATHAQTVKPLYGTLSPFYGTLSPFYGTLSPFYGNLSPFYGTLSPFYGTLSPFYGTLSPFYGTLSPFTQTTSTTNATLAALDNPSKTDPFWGSGDANPYVKNPSPGVTWSAIQPFWNTTESNYLGIMKSWQAAKTTSDFQSVANLLQTQLIAPTTAFWSKAVAAGPPKGPSMPGQPTAANIQSFATIFNNQGVTFNADGSVNAASLQNVSPTQQGMLFLNLYDAMMSYSGKGHVDWWMGATGWSPSLANEAAKLFSGQQPVTVGMLDFTVSGNAKSAKGSLLQMGSNVFSNGHGAAVGSLIMGSVDSSNIMGVLPTGTANVVVYDPYDSTGTTNWTDVGKGIVALSSAVFNKNGAPTGVINASLGEPGFTLSPGWNTALSSGAAHGHNLVVAAGNDGITQISNVPWDFAKNPTLIIVGSVGVDGTISNFSNRPGEACLLGTGQFFCSEANKLKYHFITAPGELVLVSDGNGGVTRQTGTSLAAPLVSGAIALLQTRWPWLANYSEETAQIILKSATPKGTNPGADPLYGVGELNIAASQAPLSFSNMTYYTVANGKVSATPTPVSTVVSQIRSNSQATWDASKLSFTAIETVGNTHRDFQIPMASSLVGQTVMTESGTQLFQSYLNTGIRSWVAGGAAFAEEKTPSGVPLGFMSSSVPMGHVGGFEMRMAMSPRETTFGYRQSGVSQNAEVALIGKTQSLRFGYGEGAAAIDGQLGFSQRSDYQGQRAGANPLLGLASGGAFLDYRIALNDRVSFNAGVTQRRDERDPSQFGLVTPSGINSVYAASAQHFGVDVRASDSVVLHTGLSRLHESSALLGLQSLAPDALSGGADTSGASIGFDWSFTPRLALSATTTLAHTTTNSDQSLQAAGPGLTSTAGEVALTRSQLFAKTDRLRLSFAQGMKVTSGRLQYSGYGVVDRQTGELGVTSQTMDAVGGRTPLSAELLYGRALTGQNAEWSAFLRAGTPVETSSTAAVDYMAGAKYRVSF